MLQNQVADLILELRKGVSTQRLLELRDTKDMPESLIPLFFTMEKVLVDAEITALKDTSKEWGISVGWEDFIRGNYGGTSRLQEGLTLRISIVFSTGNAPELVKIDFNDELVEKFLANLSA